MNLSYTLPHAEENILAGVKLHTLREDRGNRWNPGMKIHHSYSFRSKGGYSCFLENECKSTQKVLLVLIGEFDNEILHLEINVDRRRLSYLEGQKLIKNDGFKNTIDFINWFFPIDKKGKRKRKMWAGRIIHWTDLKY